MVADFNRNSNNDDISIHVCFHGFDIKEVMTIVSPKLSLKKFVQSLIDKFKLEQVDSCGFVGYHVLSIGDRPNAILDYYDKEANELTFESYGIGNGSDISLFYAPGASAFLKIDNQSIQKISNKKEVTVEKFIIYVSIENSYIYGYGLTIDNLNKSIREHVSDIRAKFSLPKFDSYGLPVKYIMARYVNDDEPEVLEFEDENGRELSFSDYNIKSGDHICLLPVPIPGTEIYCNVIIVKTINFIGFKYQYIKTFLVEKDKESDMCCLQGWVDNYVSKMKNLLKLNKRDDYYLAKLSPAPSSSGIKFYFINGECGAVNNCKSIYEYYDDLLPDDNGYPYLVLFPLSGISKRVLNKIRKLYYEKPRFISI